MRCLIRQRKSFIASLVVATLASLPVASAQTSVGVANRALSRVRPEGPKLVRARRAPSTIVVDGRIDDVAWQAAELATDFVQQRPTPGAAATLQTEARVMFDARALYVSMRLLDPRLELFNSAATRVQENDNWGGTPALTAAFGSVGAFQLVGDSRDAALIANLQPGSYTAQVSGAGGTTGVALVEIYELP